jgi:hypothetical protein
MTIGCVLVFVSLFCKSIDASEGNLGILCLLMACVYVFQSVPEVVKLVAWGDTAMIASLAGIGAWISMSSILLCSFAERSPLLRQRVAMVSASAFLACLMSLLFVSAYGSNHGVASIKGFAHGYYLWLCGMSLCSTSAMWLTTIKENSRRR